MSVAQWRSDWINSRPVFYNSVTKKVSHNMNDVVDWGRFEFDPEGLYNYLRFGYIVFDKTVIKNVFRLPCNGIVSLVDEGGIVGLDVSCVPDPVLSSLDRTSSVDECLHKIKKHISNFEARHPSGGFLLPLSGGHDSRLLLTMIEDKSRINAVTYDISMSQRYSSEVVLAQILAHKYGARWACLNLDDYFKKSYCVRNFDLFCLEMPIHASYHIEMFDKARQIYGSDNVVLSGSVGDWWSGEKVPLPDVRSWEDAEGLFFNHGISMPLEFIKVGADRSYNESQIAPVLDLLRESSVFKTVFSRRGRGGLASYIYRTAENHFPAYTPFFDFDVAISQLSLPQSERVDRVWQKRYFSSVGADVGLVDLPNLSISADCSQDLQAAIVAGADFVLLKESIFDGLVDLSRIRWINASIEGLKNIPLEFMRRVSNGLYAMDNSRAVKTSSGRDFDSIFSSVIGLGSLNKAIREWTLLLPIQMAVDRAAQG